MLQIFWSAPARTNSFRMSKQSNQAARWIGATPCWRGHNDTQPVRWDWWVKQGRGVNIMWFCLVEVFTMSFWSTLTLHSRRSSTASLLLPATAKWRAVLLCWVEKNNDKLALWSARGTVGITIYFSILQYSLVSSGVFCVGHVYTACMKQLGKTHRAKYLTCTFCSIWFFFFTKAKIKNILFN